MIPLCYVDTAGNQLVVDVLLHNGSEVFRSGGGRSVLLGSDSDGDHSSVQLILRNEEGKVLCL